MSLRESLGYTTTDSGIDATMALEVRAQLSARSGPRPVVTKHCLICKERIDANGWSVGGSALPVCPGDCSMVAAFYFNPGGGKLPACESFKKMYGQDVSELAPDESLTAMLSYMVHLTASRPAMQRCRPYVKRFCKMGFQAMSLRRESFIMQGCTQT